MTKRKRLNNLSEAEQVFKFTNLLQNVSCQVFNNALNNNIDPEYLLPFVNKAIESINSELKHGHITEKVAKRKRKKIHGAYQLYLNEFEDAKANSIFKNFCFSNSEVNEAELSKANKAGPNAKPRSKDNKASDKKIMNPVAGAVTKE